MNLLINALGEIGPRTKRWLRQMERKLFTVIVICAIIVLMAAWIWVLTKLAYRLLISVLVKLT
jgi:hypothetical protein